MDRIETLELHGQPALRLTSDSGASATLSLLGGQVLSWRTPDGCERLYLSDRADFSGATAIRGGVPICWPQFAAQGRLPKHGLVRTRQWSVVETRAENGYALATLSVTDDDTSHAAWPYAFELELSVLVEDNRLTVEFEAVNTGHGPFVFTGALHTYLRVAEVEEIRLEGLANSEFRDKTRDGALRRDSGDHLAIDRETDRIYPGIENALLLRDQDRSLAIHAEGFPDVVVWNPWEAHCRDLPDMADTDFRRMLCVEAAAATRPVELAAGESWIGRQTLLAL
ncbi:MAG: D-hexose-6-phosphate mutarotase [Rhodocyclaceae bacterium]|nr:D-hexose-6-phosphate mutarotase [Rhodocyclaceae bacterium]